MNKSSIKVNIVRVKRGIFSDKEGREIKFCKFTCLEPMEKEENSVGYNIVDYSVNYDNYDILVKAFESSKASGKPTSLEVEYTKLTNGYYRAKPVKVDEIAL